MLEELKREVCDANLELMKRKIVIYTWGNVSGIDREKNLMVIKPSGVAYDVLTPESMVVVDVKTGKKVEGQYNPSSDTETHLELYRRYENIGGVTHTHSVNAVAFAQAGRKIPALGTTHADYFYGDIPCTRELKQNEVQDAYEKNTGKVIIETLEENKINCEEIPGIIVKSHGPFCWGRNATQSVHNAVVLETIAEMALKTLQINSESNMPQYIMDKHYYRKHGENAYYGQINVEKKGIKNNEENTKWD